MASHPISAEELYGTQVVYTISINGVKVMRRSVDGWVNANQIAKAANLTKTHAQSLLMQKIIPAEETEVLKSGQEGAHQLLLGRWVSVPRARDFASKIGILDAISPLLRHPITGVDGLEQEPPSPLNQSALPPRAPTPPSISKAVVQGGYINYYMPLDGVRICRRGKDGFINASSILVAANLKASVRISQRNELLNGPHETAKGGNGVGGVWVPVETARSTASQFHLLEKILPLLDLDMRIGKVEDFLNHEEEIPGNADEVVQEGIVPLNTQEDLAQVDRNGVEPDSITVDTLLFQAPAPTRPTDQGGRTTRGPKASTKKTEDRGEVSADGEGVEYGDEGNDSSYHSRLRLPRTEIHNGLAAVRPLIEVFSPDREKKRRDGMATRSGGEPAVPSHSGAGSMKLTLRETGDEIAVVYSILDTNISNIKIAVQQARSARDGVSHKLKNVLLVLRGSRLADGDYRPETAAKIKHAAESVRSARLEVIRIRARVVEGKNAARDQAAKYIIPKPSVDLRMQIRRNEVASKASLFITESLAGFRELDTILETVLRDEIILLQAMKNSDSAEVWMDDHVHRLTRADERPNILNKSISDRQREDSKLLALLGPLSTFNIRSLVP